ncbi:hypothetical protein Bca4012_085476 [Brassica carinata]|uniref:Replication protein A 70 kDa DNA-binding subunit B/D first OB fold domain-containing protein n=1 Tax=Brassica carinata TaxID=52824 RepID=A0A8X7SGL0_BRACI|nr:hypothetical protein Bca52824_025661 [Brassica carinata]
MTAMKHVSDLKPFKSMWKVRVKIIRLWKQYSTASGETIEMVFLDSRGDKIHGTVKKDEVGQFVHVLQQGQTKVLFLLKFFYFINILFIFLNKGSKIEATLYEELEALNHITMNEDLYGALVGVGELQPYHDEIYGEMRHKINFSLINLG